MCFLAKSWRLTNMKKTNLENCSWTRCFAQQMLTQNRGDRTVHTRVSAVLFLVRQAGSGITFMGEPRSLSVTLSDYFSFPRVMEFDRKSKRISTTPSCKPHLEPDLLGHALCLVGEHHRVTVAPTLAPSAPAHIALLIKETGQRITNPMMMLAFSRE